MQQSTSPHRHVLPGHPGRAARVAWRAGWVLLALVSLAVAYGALVYHGQ